MQALDPNAIHALVVLLGLFLASGIASMLYRRSRVIFSVSTLLLLAIMAVSVYLFSVDADAVVLGAFTVSQFSMFFMSVFSAGLILVNALSYRYAKDFPAFSMLFALSATGAFMVVLSYSLITILLGIELMALSTAFLIIINGKICVEAAVKLFVLAAIAVGVMGFALALVFPYDPQLALASIPVSSMGTYLVMLSMLLFAGGLAVEGALFPFNLWVPDVYQGAPGNVTALLAGINKKVAFVALLEIFFVLFIHGAALFSMVFLVLSVATMFFGNIVALVQGNVKRMFAYSSISQAGYIAIGMAAATQYGIEASMFQIVAHMLMIIGAFAAILWLENKGLKTIEDYAALGSRSPMAALSLTIIMLSMIGMPPLMGFVGKFLLFSSAISAGMLALAAFAIINSFISVYYYGRLILSMYARKEAVPVPMGWEVNAVLIAVVVAIIALGIYPQPIVSAAIQASSSLLGYGH
jgi:NADH-quinone oxidoreductase subunit N